MTYGEGIGWQNKPRILGLRVKRKFYTKNVKGAYPGIFEMCQWSGRKLKVFKFIRIQIRSKSWSGNRIRIILIRTDPQHWFLSLNMKQLAFLGLKWFNFFRLQVDIRRYGKYLCKTTYNVILCLNIHKMYTKLHTYNRAGMMHI